MVPCLIPVSFHLFGFRLEFFFSFHLLVGFGLDSVGFGLVWVGLDLGLDWGWFRLWLGVGFGLGLV